jgi:hypothetical protein
MSFSRSSFPPQQSADPGTQDNLADHILVLLLGYFQIFEKLSEMVTRRQQSFGALV